MFFLKAACTWHGLDSCWRSSVLELAFGCFGTEALFCIWVPKVTCFLLAMGSNLAGVRVFWSWRSVVSEPKLCFLWVPKVTGSILSACFLLGMGSNLAGVSVFSNLTLTRL